ncbi:hypothetical protein BVC71_10350 [Marivivens niveibacter]|uniref:High-affinity zinc uptake system protein ZnuA n=1 Tax=Marivivens niveibacter TaxID=1930667 RepID=A0A251WXJ9_9RHOB|nr:zinc ABC transporter substrate-binding protein [Marivivens niveibacter]OUD09102.1 hypothetical protein BVC71_10350 [Marivivens niveibacter]
MYIRAAALLSVITTSAAQAETLKIVTDILPVGSLVQSIAGDTAEVTTLLQPGDNPHNFALRPSDARFLAEADLVIWTGEALSPFLADPIDTLAASATVIELLETEGWTPIAWREESHDDHDEHEEHDEHDHDAHAHEEHDHDAHEAEEHDAHDHDEHDEHDHDDHDEHEEDEHGHEDHDEHDHGDFDPHAWLSPAVLTAWAGTIQTAISTASPDMETEIAQNAIQTLADIDYANEAALNALADVRGIPFVVSHDALGYFESAFDVPSAGRIALSDASAPSAARLTEIKEEIEHEGIECIVSDSQSSPEWVTVVTEGADVRIITIDPLGGQLAGSPKLASESIVQIATALADCLKG